MLRRFTSRWPKACLLSAAGLSGLVLVWRIVRTGGALVCGGVTSAVIFTALAAVAIGSLVWQERRARESRRDADKSKAAKSEFLANMSHEIRTPLNGIVGMTDILAQTPLSREQREMVDIIRQSAESLGEIIEDILDLSRTETGGLQLDHVVFDLFNLVREVEKILAPLADAKGVAFKTEIGEGVPRKVQGDPSRLRQVMLNLASNAVKFTNKGGIRIEASLGGDPGEQYAVLFRVADTGIGIGKDVVNKIFAPFTQADSAAARRYGGAGLGLTISQRLVTLMGGSIGVYSLPRIGSTFWFLIPFEPAPPAPGDPAGEEPESFSPPQPAVPPPELPSETDVPLLPELLICKGRVLIVEDNPVNQIVAARVVRSLGYEVEVVSGGEQALEAFTRSHFDLILMDCQMPGMDGYQATVELRRREQLRSHGSVLLGRHTPIVAMTVNDIDGDREKCLGCGMDDYLPKPIRMESLGRTLERWTASPGRRGSGVLSEP